MDLFPYDASHIPLIEAAFARERETRPQRYSSYLAKSELADFHRDRLIEATRKGFSQPVRIAIQNGEACAVFGWTTSPFHQETYQCPYYKLQPFYPFTSDSDQTRECARLIRKELDETEPGVFAVRVEADRNAWVYWLSDAGFRHSGMSVRLAISANEIKNQIDKVQADKYDYFQIRHARPDDAQSVASIGAEDHVFSHFYHEQRFQASQTQGLFRDWLIKSVNGMAERVLVVESEGEIVGFCSFLVNSALAPYINARIGVIDFIAVKRSHQGKGLGAKLLQAIFSETTDLVDHIELRTMADNIKAIRFYESHRFRALSADQHFHYWTR